MGANQGRPGDAPGGKRPKAGKAGKKGKDEMTIAGQSVGSDKPSLSRQVSGASAPAQPSTSRVPSGEGAPGSHPHHHHHAHHHAHHPHAHHPHPHGAPATTAAVAPPPAVAAAAPAADPEFDAHSHPFHAPLDHVREEERPLQDLARVTHFDMVTLRKLQVIFTDIAESDVDDGIIDGNELTDAMGLKSSCLLARTIFRIFDIGQNKQIDFGQWVKTISALSADASLEEKIKFSFGLYDLNGDGSIDVEELRAMLEAAVKDENVLNLSDAEVSEWCAHTLSLVDRDGNGKVDYEEYRSMVRNSTKFLESFTLDITALTKSFKFKSKANSAEKLTAGEMDQRLHWFRARQRQYSSRSSKDAGGNEDGSSSTQHGQQTGQNQHPNPLSNQGRGHTTTSNEQDTPAGTATATAAQRASIAAGTPAQPSLHGLLPTATGVAVHAGSGRADIKGGSGSYKPIVLAPPLTLAPLRSASALSTSSEGPTFHDADPTPSPLMPESSPVVHPQEESPAVTGAVAAAAPPAAAAPAETIAAFPATVSDPSPSPAPDAAASPSLRLDTSDSDAPAGASSPVATQDERETAEARANFRRHHSDPDSNGAGSHSVHYTASRTPIHLLRLASVATMAGGDEVLEDEAAAPTPNGEDKQ